MLKDNWMDGQRSASSKLKFSGKNTKTLNWTDFYWKYFEMLVFNNK